MSLLWKLGLVALVALALTALPGGGGALDVVLTALTIAFLCAIALAVYRLFLRYRIDIEGMPDGMRAVLYGSIGLVFLTLCATERLFDTGAGAVAWIALLGLAALGLYRVWVRYRAYG